MLTLKSIIKEFKLTYLKLFMTKWTDSEFTCLHFVDLVCECGFANVIVFVHAQCILCFYMFAFVYVYLYVHFKVI